MFRAQPPPTLSMIVDLFEHLSETQQRLLHNIVLDMFLHPTPRPADVTEDSYV